MRGSGWMMVNEVIKVFSRNSDYYYYYYYDNEINYQADTYNIIICTPFDTKALTLQLSENVIFNNM